MHQTRASPFAGDLSPKKRYRNRLLRSGDHLLSKSQRKSPRATRPEIPENKVAQKQLKSKLRGNSRNWSKSRFKVGFAVKEKRTIYTVLTYYQNSPKPAFELPLCYFFFCFSGISGRAPKSLLRIFLRTYFYACFKSIFGSHFINNLRRI